MFVADSENSTIGYTISYGEKCKMYTLRMHVRGIEVMGYMKQRCVRSYYVKNLSNNSEKARRKAVEYVEKANSKLISDEAVEKELYEIRRLSHEEAERLREEDRVQREESWKNLQEERYQNALAKMKEYGENVMPFGKYINQTMDDVIQNDPNYVKFLVKKNQEELPFEYPTRVFEIAMNQLFDLYQKDEHSVFSEEMESEWIGEVGDKIQEEVTVKNKTTIRKEYFGNVVISVLYIFVTNTGNIIKTYYGGSKWELEIGAKATIEATVKMHDVYGGDKNTVVKNTKAVKMS